MIFDGKKFAEEIIAKLPRKKVKLAIFLDPKNASGAKYVQKKIELAKRLGVEIVMNKVDGSEDGIMVQLPHPDAENLIAKIPPEKDVDGLREDSPYMPAVVRAVCEILNTSPLPFPSPTVGEGAGGEVLVVGGRGFVGKKLIKVLGIQYSVLGMDKDDFDPEKIKMADVVISATGQKNLIDGDMVRDGFIAIDVGYPDAEFTPAALAKASFYTPVPGGVGPVTVACLFANLLGVN